MYPLFGTRVRFTVVEDFGSRVALDAEFHFAKIKLSTGEVITASFDEAAFSRLKNKQDRITAAVSGQVFWSGPTSYSTSDLQEAAERASGKRWERITHEWVLKKQAFDRGQSDVDPPFPDWKEGSYADDFALAPDGDGGQEGGVWNLVIHPACLQLAAHEQERFERKYGDVRWRNAPQLAFAAAARAVVRIGRAAGLIRASQTSAQANPS